MTYCNGGLYFSILLYCLKPVVGLKVFVVKHLLKTDRLIYDNFCSTVHLEYKTSHCIGQVSAKTQSNDAVQVDLHLHLLP